MMPTYRDGVNPDMPNDDRIDNKRIVVSSLVIVVSRTGKEVLSMSFLSPRVQLALVAVVSAALAVGFGSSHWGP